MACTDPCVNALSGAWQQLKPESHTNAINDIKNDSTIKVQLCWAVGNNQSPYPYPLSLTCSGRRNTL